MLPYPPPLPPLASIARLVLGTIIAAAGYRRSPGAVRVRLTYRAQES